MGHVETARNQVVSLDSTMTPRSDQSSFATVDSQVTEIFDFNLVDIEAIQDFTSTSTGNSVMIGGELASASRITDAMTQFGGVGILPATWNLSFDFPMEDLAIPNGDHDD